MELKADVLIIGSGIAGLFAAIKISEFADVILVTKKEKNESNTNYAQGGIAAVISGDDSFEKHITDTLVAGAGLCNEESVRGLVSDGPACINELINMGTRFTLEADRLHLLREGGHSKNRIVHARDLTGKEVERALIDRVNSIPNILLLENCFAIDLITEHNLQKYKHSPINSRHCWGAYVHNSLTNQVKKIISKVTILATGGVGQVYLHTTNPAIATGDGLAMAYRAGAKVGNLEFIQFHPTALYQDLTGSSKHSFLISEAVRGFGGILKNNNGEEFMNKYDQRRELAPRDIVARAIDNELKKRGDDFVLLDVTHKSADQIIEHFPNIYNHCLTQNIDITRQPIPVVPAAHYVCGGIVVDNNGRTSLDGLLAIGEVALTGVHGANRLASNSLLEAVVYARRAAEYLRGSIGERIYSKYEIPDWDDKGTLTADEKILITHSQKELKQLMWDYVGIVRSDLRLLFASRRVHNLFTEVEEFYKKTKIFDSLLELRNLVTCSYLIIKCAQLRKESRGLHYTIDYPVQNETAKDIIIQNTYQRS
ncbi:MAG: L-aspartate oxidase [Ignavibacteriaceae bacterium]|nr:L-aspartate oxidase [Ignavibacteriaceae bacterium]